MGKQSPPSASQQGEKGGFVILRTCHWDEPSTVLWEPTSLLPEKGKRGTGTAWGDMEVNEKEFVSCSWGRLSPRVLPHQGSSGV